MHVGCHCGIVVDEHWKAKPPMKQHSMGEWRPIHSIFMKTLGHKNMFLAIPGAGKIVKNTNCMSV